MKHLLVKDPHFCKENVTVLISGIIRRNLMKLVNVDRTPVSGLL